MSTPKKQNLNLKSARAQLRKLKVNKVLEATELQDDLCSNGYESLISIAFKVCNDLWLNLKILEDTVGVTDCEYKNTVKQLNDALKTALPYFATQFHKLEVKDINTAMSDTEFLDALKKAGVINDSADTDGV
jgi:hypothetical protein